MKNKEKSKTKKRRARINKKRRSRSKYSKTGGVTPEQSLLQAVNTGDIVLLERSIREGANVDTTDPERDYTPLMIAVDNGNARIAEILLENGADVNASDDPTGTTSLMIACEKRYTLLVNVLLFHGADKSMKNKYGQTALAVLLAHEPQGNVILAEDIGKRLRIIRSLSEHGDNELDVNIADNEGYTPLMTILAIRQANPYIHEAEAIVELLINLGADITITNTHGTRAYDIAVWRNHSDDILEKLQTQEMREQMMNIPVPMMNSEEYEKCNKNEGQVYDAISYEPLSIERAVKLEETDYCYDRENLRMWMLQNPQAPTNPMTRSPISDAWIQTNYPRGIHRSHEITNGGKKRRTRKRHRKKRKTHKKHAK